MALKLISVSARYPIDEAHIVLTKVSITVRDSGCLAVVGPSGSGKSTLGRIMNGLHRPSEGTVELDNLDIHSMPSIAEARRRVGLLMQQPDNQLFGMTVGEDIRFGPSQAGIDLDTCVSRMERAMLQVGLDIDSFAARSPFSLSGGERRRVALAGLLAMQPRHLVLDEPVAGLDPAGRAKIEAVIAETGRHIGVVLLTADLPLALRLADHVILLDAGHVEYDGAPAGAVADRALLSRLRLLAPVEADVLDALRQRGAPLEPLEDMRPATVLETIAAAVLAPDSRKVATKGRSH
ncbi:MAG: Polyamine-transporting ATPase [Chloroflexi bacterium]|jgi:energy-coupling factor transport system ATP-binding protein|nr:Polyamine-transporting ATPase [Chloroflexota bacterium]